MKRTLYLKLLLSYFIYGIVAFIIICTFTQRLTSRYMEKQEASQLYREASIIASDYATEYFKSSMSLNDFQNHMEIISDYMTAEVWVVSPDGEILLDSSDPEIGKRSNDTGAGSSPYIIKDFDITDFGNSYYTVGKFYNEFSSDQLSVFSSITEGYQTRAYIILHKDMNSVTDGINGFLNISFYTVAFIFLLEIGRAHV